jgi:hypothetical protein
MNEKKTKEFIAEAISSEQANTLFLHHWHVDRRSPQYDLGESRLCMSPVVNLPPLTTKILGRSYFPIETINKP